MAKFSGGSSVKGEPLLFARNFAIKYLSRQRYGSSGI